MFIKLMIGLIILIILLSLVLTIQIGRNPQDKKYGNNEKQRIIMLTSIYGVTFILVIAAFIIYIFV